MTSSPNKPVAWFSQGTLINPYLIARDRAGAQIFISKDVPIPPNNGTLITIYQIIKFFMSSAAGSELAALFITAKDMASFNQTLINM